MGKVRIVIALSSIVSLAICIINISKVHNSLFITAFYPLFYLVVAIPLMNLLSNRNRGCRITVSAYLLLQWLRCVFIPMISSISGYFSFVSDIADESSAQTASFLCLIELIVTSCLCYVILKYSRKSEYVQSVSFGLSGNKTIYSVFFVAMLVLYLFRGRGMFTFLALSSNVSSRASLSDRNLILQALIEYGLICFMIISLYFCYNQSKKTGKKKYIWIALLLSMLRICIISSESESRMAILYSVGVYLFLLPRLFPSEKKRIIISIFAIGFAVIGLLTIYKTFRAFMYGSYVEAIIKEGSTTDMNSTSYTFDSYFYGVKDVARNIYISRQTGLTVKNIIADVVQNIFGLKYLIPSTGNTTIGEYNFFIYNGGRISGHLYSAIAYGYSYVGFLLAPLATCINILIVAYLESLLNRFRNLDTQYIYCLIFVRSAASMFACFPLTLNYLARTLIIGTIVIGGASIFKRNKRIREIGS